MAADPKSAFGLFLQIDVVPQALVLKSVWPISQILYFAETQITKDEFTRVTVGRRHRILKTYNGKKKRDIRTGWSRINQQLVSS
jgi:hypothetical protein